jgi:protein involved in polysaccharide export with SLBB domain
VRKRTNAAGIMTLAFLMSFGVESTQGQLPTSVSEAEELLRENPELVRAQLRNSGLTQEEIRAQLVARGMPSDALDTFLSDGLIDPETAFSENSIAALEMLGIVRDGADGLELIEEISGFQPGDELADTASSPVFGHDIFRRATSRFQPLLSGPVPDTYQLGPGDHLLLLLTGEVELVYDLEVTREGFVLIPDVGRITLSGLDMAGASVLLRERLAGFYSGIRRGTTSVNLSIAELRTIQVYVTGEVRQPGAYQLSSMATVTNALYAADGPTDLGSLRSVKVRRKGGPEFSLDLYPYLLSGDASGDVTLEQGDVIFLPLKDRRVQLSGAVTRPKLYDVAEDDNLADVLIAAGGFHSMADRKRLTVHRTLRPAEQVSSNNDRVVINLALTPSEDPEAPNHIGGAIIPPVGLQDGDSIVIDTIPAVSEGMFVSIAGLVAQPDTFPWYTGMTVRDLVSLARGPIVGADLRAAEITRLPKTRENGGLAERISVPLDSSYLDLRSVGGRVAGASGLAFPPAGSSDDFILHPFDLVQIRRQPDFELPGTVVISGEVSVPGNYALLSKDDRVTDLIERAGHILPSGYPKGARLYRSLDELGRIDLDLPKALQDPSGLENLVLQPADSLHIPVYTPTVQVLGAVNSPVTVLYREDQDFEHYIAAAGGYRSDADEGRSSVRYANGLAQTRSKFLFWSSYPEPDAGSIITVPSEDPEATFDTLGFFTTLLGVVSSLATTIVVITR